MIETTIKAVKTLSQEVDNFYTKYKSGIDYDKGLCKCFKDFSKESQATLGRLENPLITIATVGTTSSGKSTILNGIIGRDIAPSDIDEMSAGILTFTPSSTEKKLIVTKSPERFWDGCTSDDLSDTEMRKKIGEIFKIYKEKKIQNRICTAPQIEIIGNYMWNVYPQMFKLPKGIRFKFIDLPGLRKETGDRRNLSVIQNVLKDVRPLSILAMDYGCLAQPETLEILLSELTETIRNLEGSTESIIFLLNKIDLHNVGGMTTLEDNIERFRNRVISKLSSELPQYNFNEIKIIPFVGLLYNNAQVSIGLQNHISGEKLEGNPEYLSRIRLNCGKVFDNAEDDIQEFYESVKRKKNLDHDELTLLMKHSYSLSHADDLIEELNRRLCDSFYEIVIYPAIFKLRIKFELLQGYLANFMNANRLSNLLSVHSRLFGMFESQIKILGTNEETSKNFIDRIDATLVDIGEIATLFDEYYPQIVARLGKNMLKTDLERSVLNEDKDIYDLLLEFTNNDNELYRRICDELKRKHSLIKNYSELHSQLSESTVEGELRTKFGETTAANKKALGILTEYSIECKKKYNNTESLITAKENAYTQLAQIDHTGISTLYRDSLGILNKIKSLIQIDLLAPFKKVYPISSTSPYDEKVLEKDYKNRGIKESSIAKLANQFINFRNQFVEWRIKPISEYNYVIYNGQKKPITKEYSSYTRKYKVLNNEMRLAISDLMGYNVQIEHKSFIENLKKILESDTAAIISEINKSGFGVDVSSIVKLLTIENQLSPEMPENLFTFADPFEMRHDTRTKTGTRVVDGSCCDSSESYNYRVNVYTVKYPTIDRLYTNWTRGIAGSEESFWEIVVGWVESTIKIQKENIESATLKVSNDVTANLDKQKTKLVEKADQNLQLLENMEYVFKEVALKYNEILKKHE